MKARTAKAMSLKGKIKNIASEKKITANVVLQNFMMERFLNRLSVSEYKDKFVIKGGSLVLQWLVSTIVQLWILMLL